MDAPFDVFLSHSIADLKAVQSLARALEGHGMRPWLAVEQGLATEEWRHEVVDVLRQMPAAIAITGKGRPGDWGQRELGEMARLKLSDPSFRFVQVVLPAGGPLSKPSVDPDGVFRFARRDSSSTEWDEETVAMLVDTLRGGSGQPADLRLSASVEAAIAVTGAASSFTIVRRLLESHPEYAGGLSASDLGNEPAGTSRRTAEEWVDAVRELYDPVQAQVLHGRLLIDGLARLDSPLRIRLEELGALKRLRSEIQPPPDVALLPKRDAVDTLTDYPADVDELGRMVLAEVLATRIRSMRQDEASRCAAHADKERRRGGPFLLHLYGAWGVGKTSLLRFIGRELAGTDDAPLIPKRRRRLRDYPLTWLVRAKGVPASVRDSTTRQDRRPDRLPDQWVVIDFNAWQHQRIVPPWWWLMTAVYRQGSKALWRLSKRRWLRLKAWDLWWRIKGAAPGLLLVAAGFGIAWLVWKTGSIEKGEGAGSLWSATESIVKALSAVIALGLTVWGGVRALSRWLVVGSPRAAGAFINHAKDPLETLSRRFATLVRRLHYPVAIFIDDLDRCQAKYVVELLEGIQTLFKDVPVAYVVAADREWLCQSYAEEYKSFCETSGAPGRPLGYLFLEKTFQLSAPVPALSIHAQRDFLHGLLRVTRPGGSAELQAARAKARVDFEDAENHADVTAKLADATHLPAVERQAAAEAAVLRLAQPDVEQHTQHTLQAFAPLLERNPRAMKRLVNAYGMARASEILRGVSSESNGDSALERVALWTILSLRWPLLADHLAENEGDVELMRDRNAPLPDEPQWLRKLWHDRQVLAVLEGRAPTVSVVLDPEAIRLSVGKDGGLTP